MELGGSQVAQEEDGEWVGGRGALFTSLPLTADQPTKLIHSLKTGKAPIPPTLKRNCFSLPLLLNSPGDAVFLVSKHMNSC